MRTGLSKELPRWSRSSQSPSRASFRGGSASPDGSRCHSQPRLRSPSRRADEDRQEEQSSLDFVSVVATLWSLDELPEAPLESRKIHGFRAALEDDDQSASSYCLPVGGASGDILSDIDDHIVFPSSGMRFKKVLKLLFYPGVRSCRFYRFEGEESTKPCSLNRHVTELTGMRSFDNLNKTDVILSSSEAEDMEAAMWSIVEATSWMDWWRFAMKSLALKYSSDACLIRRLSLAGARCQFLVAKTASTLWANLVLKKCDTVLAKVKDSISFESLMNLRNVRLSNSTDLFPAVILEKAVEKSLRVFHVEAVRKAVAQEKPQH